MRRMVGLLTDTNWIYRHRGKIGGLLFGTLGTWTIALFVLVAVTGVPFGSEPPPAPQVYFIE